MDFHQQLPNEDIINDLSKQYSIAMKYENQISAEINKNRFRAEIDIKQENPFHENEKILEKAEKSLKEKNYSINQIKADYCSFRDLINFNGKMNDEVYWITELDKLEKKQQNIHRKTHLQKLKIFRTLLQKKWREYLEKDKARFELEWLNSFRNKLLKQLLYWLKILEQIDVLINKLNIQPGLLFDLSKNELKYSELDKLKEWAEYISKDEGVKKLCDMLGRVMRAQNSKRKEVIKYQEEMAEYIPDSSSKEEITGICLSDNISYALPQEVALLSDSETSILFYKKLIEGSLMSFDMEGLQIYNNKKDKFQEIEVKENKAGPVIICVDTSGSMQGSPETIAKAVTLFISSRAVSQNRKCYLINFSTSITTMEFSSNKGLKDLIEFLNLSFHGGTDVHPALNHALDLIGKEDYDKSDILIISDFIMSSLTEDICNKIATAKSKDNKFYSLTIGDIFLDKELKAIFDKEWIYNPDKSKVEIITSVSEEMF
jgi:uncharacterized protein with von Willebrand factor type A (vWA) domain